MPVKPSEKEEEYFAREEFERKRKLELEKKAKMNRKNHANDWKQKKRKD